MFTRILTHEWRALRADSTIWVIAAVFAAAIGYGVWNGARWVGFQQVTPRMRCRARASLYRECATCDTMKPCAPLAFEKFVRT